ncbi:MAG TPA: phosphotransferase [Gammaproteobacteria bacterium]|nr:phosphotransferase [Gammaproteobacteria bacterium]
MSDRFEQLHIWAAEALHLRTLRLEPISVDASFRRYFRIIIGSRSYIVMDAPPPQEDCRPFVRIARLLKDASVHVPEILAEDLARGFLLLTDLGQHSYLDVLKADNADALMTDAITTLIKWQQASQPEVLPAYDRPLLHRELNLFLEWYVQRHLNITLTDAEFGILEATFKLLEDNALAQPRVYVHRDYMSRNLMVSAPNPGVLDFQDAVYGPITYDLVSLFKDAFISWEQLRVDAWRKQYWQLARQAGLTVQALPEFERAFDWMGLQRHLKVLGIFARIYYRDGKSGYLEDTPRFLNYVSETGRLYKEFIPLLSLLDSIESRARKAKVAT